MPKLAMIANFLIKDLALTNLSSLKRPPTCHPEEPEALKDLNRMFSIFK